MKSCMKVGCGALILAALVAGCETATMDNQGPITLAELQGITVEPTPTPSPSPSPSPSPTPTPPTDGSSTNVTAGGWPAEITGPIKWTGPDISDWAQTASLNASVSGGTISMPYDKSRVWPAVKGLNGNCWAIVNIGGQWYAGTFEYLRSGQTSKPVGVLNGSKGDHFKVSPLSSWRPRSGERIGIMVSGLARGGMRNVQERSNVDMVTWP